jgi:hypothetical protein
MNYKLVEFADLKEGQLVLAFGVHMLRWNFDEWGDPTYAFVSADEEPDLEEEEVIGLA